MSTIAYLPLKEDAPLHRALEKVKQIAGVSQAYYGRRLEDSSIVDVIIDWSSTTNASKLKDSLLSGELNSIIKPALTGLPTCFTMQHQWGPGTFLDTNQNPVTEIATFFFLPNIDDQQLGEFDQAFVSLEQAVAAQPGHVTSGAGHITGTVDNPDIGAPVKGFIAAVGWTSPEAHVNFTKTPEFGQSLGKLIPFLSGNADHHVYFQKA